MKSAKDQLEKTKKLKQIAELQEELRELEQLKRLIESYSKDGKTSFKFSDIKYPGNRQLLTGLGYTIIETDDDLYKHIISWDLDNLDFDQTQKEIEAGFAKLNKILGGFGK